MLTAMTMTHAGEALGIARAARTCDVPVSMGLTVETDGRLPTGQPLGEAIEEIDASGAAPAYYMINCAHPDHFRDVLAAGGAWRDRIRASAPTPRAGAMPSSTRRRSSIAGDPAGLGADHAELLELLPNLCVFGGCCGTDHRHVAAMADACLTPAA